MIKTLLLCIFIILNSQSFSSDDFTIDKIHSVPRKYQESKFKIFEDLHIVFMKGQWSVDKILNRFEKLRNVYSQCEIGVNISSIREVEWKYPSKGLYYDLNNKFENRYYDGTLQLLVDLDISQRPLALFIDSFDEDMKKVATSFPPSSIEKSSIALNTFWITNLVNEQEYLELEPDDYSVFAHELGHILLDDSHEMGAESNLMHSKLVLLSGELTKEQCQIMRKGLL